MIVREVVPVVAPLSLTVSVTVTVPAWVKVSDVCGPVAVWPSLLDHVYVSGPPSGSNEAAPLSATVNGARPDVGVAVNDAVGGTWFTVACTWTEDVCVAPS